MIFYCFARVGSDRVAFGPAQGGCYIPALSIAALIGHWAAALDPMTNRALITGITGQDGAYLAQLLHGKGYELFGLIARRGTESLWRLRELGVEPAVSLIQGDLTDLSSLIRAIEISQPPVDSPQGEVSMLA
jgi:hypothetical protein